MNKYDSLINEYAQSHTNPTNIKIHHVCVPIITLSVLLFFRALSLSFINLADVVFIFAMVYYVSLNKKLFFPLFIFMGTLNLATYFLISLPHILLINIAVFVIAWIGQFIGHKIEGKKPSFFKDIQFLLIGPLWVLKKWGLVE